VIGPASISTVSGRGTIAGGAGGICNPWGAETPIGETGIWVNLSWTVGETTGLISGKVVSGLGTEMTPNCAAVGGPEVNLGGVVKACVGCSEKNLCGWGGDNGDWIDCWGDGWGWIVDWGWGDGCGDGWGGTLTVNSGINCWTVLGTTCSWGRDGCTGWMGGCTGWAPGNW